MILFFLICPKARDKWISSHPTSISEKSFLQKMEYVHCNRTQPKRSLAILPGRLSVEQRLFYEHEYDEFIIVSNCKHREIKKFRLGGTATDKKEANS